LLAIQSLSTQLHACQQSYDKDSAENRQLARNFLACGGLLRYAALPMNNKAILLVTPILESTLNAMMQWFLAFVPVKPSPAQARPSAVLIALCRWSLWQNALTHYGQQIFS
jgi:hypothetical protein